MYSTFSVDIYENSLEWNIEQNVFDIYGNLNEISLEVTKLLQSSLSSQPSFALFIYLL